MVAYAQMRKLRHYTEDGVKTSCARDVVEIESLPLPVNCKDCLTVNGEKARKAISG